MGTNAATVVSSPQKEFINGNSDTGSKNAPSGCQVYLWHGSNAFNAFEMPSYIGQNVAGAAYYSLFTTA